MNIPLGLTMTSSLVVMYPIPPVKSLLQFQIRLEVYPGSESEGGFYCTLPSTTEDILPAPPEGIRGNLNTVI